MVEIHIVQFYTISTIKIINHALFKWRRIRHDKLAPQNGTNYLANKLEKRTRHGFHNILQQITNLKVAPLWLLGLFSAWLRLILPLWLSWFFWAWLSLIWLDFRIDLESIQISLIPKENLGLYLLTSNSKHIVFHKKKLSFCA